MKPFYLIAFLFLKCDTIPNNYNVGTNSSSSINKSQEFKNLMTKDQISKSQLNAEVLNYLLNDSDLLEKKQSSSDRK